MAKSPCRRASSMNTVRQFRALGISASTNSSLGRRAVVCKPWKKSAAAISRRPVAALQHEPRVERQCAGWQFSRRVRQGDAATKGTAIAHGEVGNMRHGLRDQRQVLVDDRRIGDLDVASERADADVPVCQTYTLQRVELVDIDEQLRLGEPHVESRHQALPAGQDLGIVAVRIEQLQDLRDAAGADIVKFWRLHAPPNRQIANARAGCHCPCAHASRQPLQRRGGGPASPTMPVPPPRIQPPPPRRQWQRPPGQAVGCCTLPPAKRGSLRAPAAAARGLMPRSISGSEKRPALV